MEIEKYIIAEDSQLVELVLEGDDIAFEYLFTRYKEGIYRLLLTRKITPADADDIMQETFIKVYIYMARYNPKYTFGQWIYTIARNSLIDFKRRQKGGEIAIDEGYALEESNSPSPEQSVINSQQTTHIEESLRQLSEIQQQLFRMRFFDEFSYEEISEKLQMPMGSVKTNIHRARTKMCQLIIETEE